VTKGETDVPYIEDAFLGQLMIVPYNFAPKGWAFCNGQLLPINQNQALFSLLGTVYGGNGTTNFALPDLRGRVAVHNADGHHLGQRAGAATHTLSIQELPTHIHFLNGQSAAATTPVPTGNVLAAAANLYGDASNLVALHPQSITNVGGSQPHENRQPYLTLNFVISLVGIFPTHN
jgi:microcystin-dependent protein